MRLLLIELGFLLWVVYIVAVRVFPGQIVGDRVCAFLFEVVDIFGF